MYEAPRGTHTPYEDERGWVVGMVGGHWMVRMVGRWVVGMVGRWVVRMVGTLVKHRCRWMSLEWDASRCGWISMCGCMQQTL